VFGRRSKSPQPETSEGSAKAAGKGHPTPTRKEAEEARKARLTVPKSRRDQAARSREQTRDARARVRTALQTGDDKYLPARDKGPVKRYIRDYVDSRRTIGELLLPVFFVVFMLMIFAGQSSAGSAVNSFGSTAWLFIILLMVVDSVRIVRGVKAGVRERFGDDQTKGVSMYAVMRAWQMRRLRLPKPQVSHGDEV
jgi:hypothetical protein